MEDLSYKEIADVLALPLGTVQSRIARAKIQLLRRLSETNLPLEQTKSIHGTPKRSCFSIAERPTIPIRNFARRWITLKAIQSLANGCASKPSVTIRSGRSFAESNRRLGYRRKLCAVGRSRFREFGRAFCSSLQPSSYRPVSPCC